MGVEGAERMGRGPILARKKRNFGCFFCVLLNLLSNKGRPNSFLHASCASYIAKAITLIQNNHILLIALDSVQIVQFCNHMISVQLPRHSSMFTHLVPVMPQNLIRIMKTHN